MCRTIVAGDAEAWSWARLVAVSTGLLVGEGSLVVALPSSGATTQDVESDARVPEE